MPVGAQKGSDDGSQRPKWRRYARRALLIIEVVAIIGFLVVGSRLWRIQNDLQRELAMAENVKSALTDIRGTREAGAAAVRPEVVEMTATHPPLVRVVGRIRLVIPALNNAMIDAEGKVWDPAGAAVEPKVLSTIPGEPGDLIPEVLGDNSTDALPDLNRLRVGYEILVESEQRTFRYQIREITVLAADEAWETTQRQSADLTLISSARDGVEAQRLVVFAYLEDVETQ